MPCRSNDRRSRSSEMQSRYNEKTETSQISQNVMQFRPVGKFLRNSSWKGKKLLNSAKKVPKTGKTNKTKKTIKQMVHASNRQKCHHVNHPMLANMSRPQPGSAVEFSKDGDIF